MDSEIILFVWDTILVHDVILYSVYLLFKLFEKNNK